jgi:hypothetical protein
MPVRNDKVIRKNVDQSSDRGYDLQWSALAEQIETSAGFGRKLHLNIWSQGERTYKLADGSQE